MPETTENLWDVLEETCCAVGWSEAEGLGHLLAFLATRKSLNGVGNYLIEAINGMGLTEEAAEHLRTTADNPANWKL
jgi:hypothetical protein